MLTLPTDLRESLKDPLGPVFTDADELVASVSGPLVAVGDVVTYHLLRAERPPDVALVDWVTEREPVDDAVASALDAFAADAATRRVDVENPAATLTDDLLAAIRNAVDSDERTLLVVDGEEDLATLPVVVAAPTGASVVYGQPGAGMVHVEVTEATRRRCRDLLAAMDGDVDAALALLGDI